MSRDLVTGWARVLLDLARVEDAAVTVHDEVLAVRETLGTSPELRAFLSDRSVLAEGKQSALVDLFGRELNPLVAGWLATMAAAGHGRELEAAIDAYLELSASDGKEIIGEVETALPLSDGDRERLEKALSRRLERQVRLVPRLRPELLGGVRVSVGSRVFDGSVQRRLRSIRTRLSQ